MAKTFTSQSLQHFGSYSAVKQTTSYALSYKYVAVFSTYAVALINFAQDNVVAKFPYAIDLLKFADAKVDSLLLGNVDSLLSSSYVKKVEDVSAAYKKKAESTVATYKKKAEDIKGAVLSRVQQVTAPYQKKLDDVSKNVQDSVNGYKKKGEETVSAYLKPVNDYASSTVDKVLPKSKKVAKDTKAAAETEFAKSIEIVNDTLERSKDLITSKTNDVSSAVVSTYNSEFESAPDKNYYVKVASALVSTGVILLKNVNSEYIQPLKESTQTYVQETIAHTEDKAKELVSSTEKTAENVSVQLNSALNGAIPVVSASA